jgi:hypothetical protein
MEVTLVGMSTLGRLEHPSNASSPMELTLLGMA